MISSRDLNELLPEVHMAAINHQRLCKEAGIDIIFTSTYRDVESQNALYAIGRTTVGAGVSKTKPMGRVVTNARGGDSFHQYRVAYDVAILRNGKLLWDDTPEGRDAWQKVGELGEQAGLEWAGRWKTFKEMAHFQLTKGLTLAQLKQERSTA